MQILYFEGITINQGNIVCQDGEGEQLGSPNNVFINIPQFLHQELIFAKSRLSESDTSPRRRVAYQHKKQA